MLTFTEEEFEKYQNRIAGERREAQLRRSYQGAVSRAQGAQFEQAIAGACDLYREKGMADIEKTPEPMTMPTTMQIAVGRPYRLSN